MKKCKFAAVKCRNMKPGLSHKSQKADCLEGYGFTTGIRTCDDKKIKCVTEPDVDWDHFLFGDEWMTGLFEIDASFIVKNRFAGIHIHGKCSSCKYKIKLYHDLKVQ